MYFQAKYLTKKTTAGSVEAVKSLDDILVQLAVSLFHSSWKQCWQPVMQERRTVEHVFSILSA